ncbi:putative GMC oxidoreductase [Pestalotiopsis sp. NC0098]|nr:putative GMC oxidoreductase [Pestalotiopsis sp. NC0098]
MADEFDYIVVGGGTSGSAVSARLSEDPNLKILLLEAGADSTEVDNVHMVGAWALNHTGETDWNFVTPSQPGLNGRQCVLPRAKLLGGCSCVNASLSIRGVKQDYDDWGFPEWSGEEMFRAMKKAEKFHPQEWFPENKDAHGYDGLVHIEPAPCGPLGELFLENFQSKGLPYIPDLFSTGEAANGCGHAMRTTWQGSRSTAADYITKDKKRPNVEIRCHMTADRVILDRSPDGTLQAKGIEYVDEQGNKHKAFARKEVIVSCGSYGSPAVLLRSGIGPKAELDAVGVPCELDLPGVGKNLSDHQLIFFHYEVNQDDLTEDAKIYHDPDAFEKGVKEWKEKKTGWLSTFPFGPFAYARLDERLTRENAEWRSFARKPGRDPMELTETQPNVEMSHTIAYAGPPEHTDFPKEGQYAFTMVCLLMGMQSRGEVTLKSADPRENPTVDHRYFSDRRDLLMMSEGVRFANELVTTGAGTKDKIKGSWPPGRDHHTYKTNEDWQPFVEKYTSTSYHPVGTCTIGKSDDPMAVVDQGLRVYGVKGLRVVDCSIMPVAHSGNTQMPAYGIGEIAAELIHKDAQK